MNNYQRIKILFLFTISMVIPNTIFSVAYADVLGHVEDHQIEGQVINHVISPDGKYLFSTTISPTKLHVHLRDPETGKLITEIQTLVSTDFVPGKDPFFNPLGMVVSPDGKQLYISSAFGVVSDPELDFSDSVLRFDINTNGELSYQNRVMTSHASDELAITNNGKYIYVGSTGSHAEIVVLSRATDGNISTVEIATTDLNSNEFQDTENIIISPDDENLYVSSVSFDSHLYVFDIDQSTGKLTSTKTFINKNINDPTWLQTGDIGVTGSGGSGTAISDDGKFFYSVGGYGDDKDSISIFSRSNDGSLNFIKNVQAPLSNTGTLRILYSADADLIISPNQKYIYTFDRIIKTLGVWKRDLNTGDLVFLGSINNIEQIHANNKMVTSKDERHLYLNARNGIVVFDLRADMSVVKTDGADPVKPSAMIDYTLAVTNNAPSDAQNVVVVDTLPAGTSFVSGTVNSPTGSCSASGQVVTCTMGQVLAGDGYNAVIKVTAPATAGTITNTATVTSDQLDTNTTNDTDTETTTISSNGTTAPTNPTTPSTGGGGGSFPLELIALLMFPALLRRRKHS